MDESVDRPRGGFVGKVLPHRPNGRLVLTMTERCSDRDAMAVRSSLERRRVSKLAGQLPIAPGIRAFTHLSQPWSWVLKSVGEVNRRPGRNEVSR